MHNPLVLEHSSDGVEPLPTDAAGVDTRVVPLVVSLIRGINNLLLDSLLAYVEATLLADSFCCKGFPGVDSYISGFEVALEDILVA